MESSLATAISAVFAQLVLLALVMGRLLALRLRDLKSGHVRMKDVALNHDAYSQAVQKAQSNQKNQFELPVLFYVCVAMAAATDAANTGLAVFSVLFVGARYLHAWIHLGTNYLPRRFFAYLAGAFALIGCWLSLAFGLLRLV